MNISTLLIILTALVAFIVLGLLFIYAFSIILEIPEFYRSWRLRMIALAYGLSFTRVKEGVKNWKNGWGVFSNDKSNFISGKIKDINIEFNDFLLVTGTFMPFGPFGNGLNAKPSIAEVSNKWNLSGMESGAKTLKVSRLNGQYFQRMKLKDLKKFLNSVSVNNNDEYINDVLEEKNMSKYTISNRGMGGMAFAISFISIMFIWTLVYNSSELFDSKDSIAWMFGFNLFVSTLIFRYVSKKFGIKFSPDDINKPPIY